MRNTWPAPEKPYSPPDYEPLDVMFEDSRIQISQLRVAIQHIPTIDEDDPSFLYHGELDRVVYGAAFKKPVVDLSIRGEREKVDHNFSTLRLKSQLILEPDVRWFPDHFHDELTWDGTNHVKKQWEHKEANLKVDIPGKPGDYIIYDTLADGEERPDRMNILLRYDKGAQAAELTSEQTFATRKIHMNLLKYHDIRRRSELINTSRELSDQVATFVRATLWVYFTLTDIEYYDTHPESDHSPYDSPAQITTGHKHDMDIGFKWNRLLFGIPKSCVDAGAEHNDAIYVNYLAGETEEDVRAAKRPLETSDDIARKFAESADEDDGPGTDRFEDIGGLDDAKRTLGRIATMFAKPDVMKKWSAERPRGVLLYGEPGNGKKMLVRALARKMGATIETVQNTDIGSPYVSVAENRMKEIISRVSKTKEPLVLFIDKFDTTFSTVENARGSADISYNNVASILVQEMHRATRSNPNVLLVATAASKEKIDPALLDSGLFDYKIYVPKPDKAGRREIFANIISKAILQSRADGFALFADGLDADAFAAATDGMNGREVQEIFRRLKTDRAIIEAETGEAQPPISQADIENEIVRYRTGG
jgi:SpoVK/Ycf46/Vps4 family AAA+-type ATPase